MHTETPKKKSHARHLFWLIPAAIIVLPILVIGINTIVQSPYLPRFGWPAISPEMRTPEICNTPGYDKIKNSMTQEEVRSLLGTPDNLLSKEQDSEKGTPFENSPDFKNYKEVWIYFGKPGQNIGGSISIMISNDKKVIWKTCGNG